MEAENGQEQIQNVEVLAQVVALDSQLSCSGRDLCRLPFVWMKKGIHTSQAVLIRDEIEDLAISIHDSK